MFKAQGGAQTEIGNAASGFIGGPRVVPTKRERGAVAACEKIASKPWGRSKLPSSRLTVLLELK